MLVAIILNRLNGGTRNSQAILFGLPGTDFNVRFTALVWVASFLVAVVFNFQLNRTWTFGGAARSRWWSEFWRFLLVGSVAAVVGLAMKIALTHPDSPIYLPEPWFNEEVGLSSREYWAQLVAIVCTMPVNFLVNRFWTFGNGDGEGRRLRRR
ncbi:GtrA family protein [Serinibacter arcticus]|uniref:GtrA family protein n=2 Tax=Serinibacter arcticus TaxID=1655435 RepID=A0A2U2A0A7_9MICO|nr:GtrA family protein [Serinibacter arcticus]